MKTEATYLEVTAVVKFNAWQMQSDKSLICLAALQVLTSAGIVLHDSAASVKKHSANAAVIAAAFTETN